MVYFNVTIVIGNPFVRVLTPTPVEIFQCQIASIVFRAALNSDGISNAANEIRFERFQNGPTVENFTQNLLDLQSLSSQLFQIDIIANSSQNGEYYLCKSTTS